MGLYERVNGPLSAASADLLRMQVAVNRLDAAEARRDVDSFHEARALLDYYLASALAQISGVSQAVRRAEWRRS